MYKYTSTCMESELARRSPIQKPRGTQASPCVMVLLPFRHADDLVLQRRLRNSSVSPEALSVDSCVDFSL